MSEIIVDGTMASMGRLASFVAKQGLKGNKIVILNSDKTIILGNAKKIIEDYKAKRRRQGGIFRGPKFPSSPERILKRTIRGMLPKTNRGREILKKIICYADIPEQYKDKKRIIGGKVKNKNFITLGKLSGELR
jgi:large subunit ribosomal protein L13